MRDHTVSAFKTGIIDAIEAQSIPDGAASESLNWVTKGDKIELRRGSKVVGSEISGLGRVSGLHTAYRADGTEVWFTTYGRNVVYYDTSLECWRGVGIGSSLGVIDSYGETNQRGQWNLGASWKHVGQSFYSLLGGTLDSAKFYLRKVNNPPGDLYAKIYAMTGTYGSGSTPTGSALATSDPIVADSISSSYALVTFTFSGANRITLDPNTNYCVVVNSTATTGVHNVDVGWDSSSSTHGGNAFMSTTGASWTISTYDAVFYVYAYIKGDILPAGASGEDIIFANCATNAGAQVWFGSPNSSLYKIMTANPADYADMYNASQNYKGYIKIEKNRMWLWGRNEDKTGVYGSYIDTGNYTAVAGEATTSLTGTLAFKAAGAKRTCFGVTITLTVSGEVYTDDYNGVLTGSLGGTGTINYMTGAYTLSNAGVGTASYQWEDSTNQGIADFTKSSPRLAGQGFVFRQDDGGGEVKNIFTIGDTQYCLHELRTWALTLTATDTNATNEIFRYNVGIPYLRAGVASSAGIFYIDVTDKSKPVFRKLTPSQSGDIAPRTVSLNVNLEGYTFDQCSMIEWNDYIIFTGATSDSTIVNRMFIYHKTWGSIDILDYFPSCFAIGNGTLLAGESVSNNVVTLFSGFEDSDALINNYWIGNVSDLGIAGYLKKSKRLVLEGEIQANQAIDVYISSDRGGFVQVGTVSGSGSYVDTARVLVGTDTVGSKEVGGGGDGVEAFHYLCELRLALDKFENRQIKFVATGIGYASISKFIQRNILLYAQKIPRKYRQ